QSQSQSLPSGTDLAKLLASYSTHGANESDLARVSQCLELENGQGWLYRTLDRVFGKQYPPTAVHRFLAELPGILRQQGTPQYQLIVTTNYDDLLERAFATAGEPVDTVTYLARGKEKGRFLHRSAEGEERVIKIPNKYNELSTQQRTVILKLHGAFDSRVEKDSYVISEDHYIEYLTHTDVSDFLPVKIAAELRDEDNHLLFLGYRLRDWNLRVMLHRIWGSQQFKSGHWSVQLHPEEIDKLYWATRGVQIQPIGLDAYIAGVRAAFEPPTGTVARSDESQSST
ncbi:MAG: SIR2 family NAD-dependent protein deacylase, partial [Acidimicrobiia bacterium]